MITAEARRRLPAIPSLVVLDVDGTLLTSEHRLTDRTRDVIACVCRQGIEVVLATSRGPAALVDVLESLTLPAPLTFIASQGALIGGWTADGGLRIVRRHPAPPAAARVLVARALAQGLSVSWFTGDRWLVSHVDAMVETEIAAVGTVPETADLMREREGPDKLMLMTTQDDVEPLHAVARELPDGLVGQYSHPNFLEITGQGVDKAIALAEICSERQIRPESVIAIGDGLNDLQMLAFAGVSIAPANARTAVLRTATYRTRSNDQEGVAHALEALFL